MGYFARIGKPKELRINILEASKETVICLVKEKELMSIRAQKQKVIEDVQKDIYTIQSYSRRIEQLFPYKELKEEALKEKKERDAKLPPLQTPELKEIPTKKETIKTTPPKPLKKELSKELKLDPHRNADLDRLEYTLKNIEKKIAELNQ